MLLTCCSARWSILFKLALSPHVLYVQKRMNLTKTVRKLPITSDLERKGYYMHDDKQPDIKYDSEEVQVRPAALHFRYCLQ